MYMIILVILVCKMVKIGADEVVNVLPCERITYWYSFAMTHT